MIYNQILLRYEKSRDFLLTLEENLHRTNLRLLLEKKNQNWEKQIYFDFLQFLEQQFPQDGLVVEDFSSKKAENEYTWFLDPIDGTSNFYTGVSFFSVVISLVFSEKEPVLSYVLDLNARRIYAAHGETNRCYHIKSGHWEEISWKQNSHMKMGDYVLIGRIFGHTLPEELEDFREIWWQLAVGSKSYRQLGSIALQMILDGWKRTVVCFCLSVRWFDILAPVHFLSNWGYHFSISENRECLIVYRPEIFPCEALEKMLELSEKKWKFFPSNTLDISR